jgi:hypothetical protein
MARYAPLVEVDLLFFRGVRDAPVRFIGETGFKMNLR